MGDSIWNNFLDETMKERYELVAERIVEISKEPPGAGMLQRLFFRGSSLSGENDGIMSDGNSGNFAAAQSGDLQG